MDNLIDLDIYMTKASDRNLAGIEAPSPPPPKGECYD